jgi:peptide chain release factor 2
LAKQSEEPSFWDKPEVAREVMKEKDRLTYDLNNFNTLTSGLADAIDFIKMGEEQGDAEVVLDAEKELEKIATKVKQLETESLLSGEADSNNAFLEIHPGAGGTESHDWADMLLRMYLRWAEDKGFKTETLDHQPGEVAGIKSATIRIIGHNAYGLLKTEAGVHRLVRISPFDSNARRHTSFASVWIYPEVDDNINIIIDEKDLRIDTYRASGAGGQHVNKTDSAVRITHIPTNIAVACQNDRSQHKNRAEAYKMLRARLYELELQKREEAAAITQAGKKDIGWGHQIRSYVLHPYQMIKDARTGYEDGNSRAVLDGRLDGFIFASLSQKIG